MVVRIPTIPLSIICVLLLVLSTSTLKAQESDELKLILPDTPGWNQVTEGGTFNFSVSASIKSDSLTFNVSPKLGNISLIGGNFSWQPNDQIFERGQSVRSYKLLFSLTDGIQTDSSEVELFIHKRVVEEVKPMDMPRITGIELPVAAGWNLIKEGDTLRFRVNPITNNGQRDGISYKIEEGELSSIQLDSEGNFFWSPAYDYVDRFQQTRDKHLFIIAEDSYGNVVSEKLVVSIFHRNQSPAIGKLLPFYVLLGTNNTYSISNSRVTDPDGDPIVFIPDQASLPDGMTFSSSGKISWSPSRRQFNQLRAEPVNVPFFVEDQPAKSRTRGVLLIEASQQDMPPDITMVPSDTIYTIDENERLHLVFHLSDPNGDTDIDEFGFVSDDPRVDVSALREYTSTQYEFIWMPGYEFVNDPDPFLEFDIRFFVLDKAKKTKERSITIRIKDTEDLAKKDQENYEMYKASLSATLNLMDQLEDNHKTLEKELKRAKKSKKNRTLINIGFGAITGFSPLISQDNTQKTISVIGGTTTTTLGTLEAKDVIGTSVTEISNKIKVNTELFSQLLSEGTALARRYNSKLSRRDRNFTFDLEKLNKIINSPNITTLEMDAGWENKKDLSNRRIKSVFTEFDIVDDKD